MFSGIIEAILIKLCTVIVPGGGGTCYVGVPGDVPFSWVYFLPENYKAVYTFCPKILK